MNLFRKYAKICTIAALVLAGFVGMTVPHIPGFAPHTAQAQDQTSQASISRDQMEAFRGELQSLRSMIRNLQSQLIDDSENQSLKELLSSAMSDYAKVVVQMQKSCTSALEADIYMMLDRTGSMSGTDLTNERSASKGLLGFFDDASPAPLVGIGAFGGLDGSQAATVHGLTNSETPAPYGDNDDASDGDLYAAINQATAGNSSVGTNVGAALIVGQGTLASGALPRDILIIVSDGDPSAPGDVDDSGADDDVFLDINGNGRIDSGDDLAVNYSSGGGNDFIVVNGLLQISNGSDRLNALDVTENGSLSNSDDFNFGPDFTFAIVDGRLHVAADSDGTINDQLIDREGGVNASVYARYWATRAKSAGTEVFTIAFGANSTGQNLLRQIATNDDHAYISPSSSDLGSIFLQIAEEICGGDDTPPEIECPANIIADVKDNCSDIVEFNVEVKDEDPNVKVSCSPSSGSTFPVGTTTVNCTATDSSENSASCSFTVTVQDDVPPSITCPANIVKSTDAGVCAATVQFTPTGQDNCGSVTITSNPPSGTSFPKGVTTVTVTATDASGNSSNCTFTVTINDTESPSITCPANLNVNAAQGLCAATVNYNTPKASDNCSGLGAVVCNPAPGSSFSVGTTTVTCNVTDSSGNSANCSFTLKVNDVQPPDITCPANIVTSAAQGQCAATVSYNTPKGSDSCGGNVTVSCLPASGSSFNVGTTTVTCTATDTSGNSSNCSFTVKVNDGTPPSITCPANITVSTAQGQCAATVNYNTPNGTDNCGGSVNVVCSPASGSSFSVGTTTVTCTATDSGGNSANCSFTVKVNDSTPPSITCPANITVNAVQGQCAATVNYNTPNGTDNCSGNVTVSCLPASGSSFNVGTTTVTCTATDASSNSSNCSFTVKVNDTQPPAITCPANITVPTAQGQCAATVNYNTPNGTDNCGGSVNVVCSPASGSSFSVGTTTVTCTATDASGNSSNCSFTVNVTDSTPPSITCPSNIIVSAAQGQCAATVNYNTPSGTDNCSDNVSVVCVPASGSAFPVGTTTVTCTANDGAGNSANCSFTVKVNDNTPPVITCPSNIVTSTVAGQCAATVNYSTTATDNCSSGVTLSCTPPSGSSFPLGATTVNCTATDGSGNSSGCSFTVTVNDNTPPTIACPANIVSNTAPGLCSAVINYSISATDNCGGPVSVMSNPPSGSTFPKGVTTVTAIATDQRGNTATCSFTVTVNDMEPPQIICSPVLMVAATSPGSSCATVDYPLPAATDNCPNVTVTCTPAPGSCFPVGTTTVNCVATDTSGNTTSAESCDTPIIIQVFDTCLQDDTHPGRIVLFNSQNGDYLFCCDNMTLSGRGIVKKKGGDITITHTTSTRSIFIKVSKTAFKGVATARDFASQYQCEAEDRDMRNNTCICGTTGNNILSRQN